MATIIKTQEDLNNYLEDLKFSLDLNRLSRERLDILPGHHKYPKRQAEEILSDIMLNMANTNRECEGLKLPKGTFDVYVLGLKIKSVIESLEAHPEGILINDVGGITPLKYVTWDISEIEKEYNSK